MPRSGEPAFIHARPGTGNAVQLQETRRAGALRTLPQVSRAKCVLSGASMADLAARPPRRFLHRLPYIALQRAPWHAGHDRRSAEPVQPGNPISATTQCGWRDAERYGGDSCRISPLRCDHSSHLLPMPRQSGPATEHCRITPDLWRDWIRLRDVPRPSRQNPPRKSRRPLPQVPRQQLANHGLALVNPCQVRSRLCGLPQSTSELECTADN